MKPSFQPSPPSQAQAAPTQQAASAEPAHISGSSKRQANRVGGQRTEGPLAKRPNPIQTRTRFYPDGTFQVHKRELHIEGLSSKGKIVTAMIKGEVTDLAPNGEAAHSDAHFHPTDYVQRGYSNPKELIEMMDQLGMRHCVLMPIPTSLQEMTIDGMPRRVMCEQAMTHRLEAAKQALAGQEWTRLGSLMKEHHCGTASYYIPQQLEEEVAGKGQKLTFQHFVEHPDLVKRITDEAVLYVDTAVNSHLARHLQMAGLTEAERSRLDPMITGVNLADIRAGEKLLKELFMNKGTFTGIGEITVHKELVQEMYADQKGQTTTLASHSLDGLKNLLEMAGVVGAPVVLHCDVDDLTAQIKDVLDKKGVGVGREPAHFAGLQNLFSDPRLKDAPIVWAHGGGLGRFVQEGPGHLERLGKLLDKCPNLHLDISWSQVAKQINRTPESKEAWTAFLQKNSERICFGSDALVPKSALGWNETKTLYKEVLGSLTPKAANDVLNGTYERVFVAARAKVRAFEDKVLTPEFHEHVLMAVDGERPVSADTVRHAKEAALAAG